MDSLYEKATMRAASQNFENNHNMRIAIKILHTKR